MTAEAFVRLMEEMIDLKVQQHVATQLKTSPELARLVAEKRESDRRRLEQIRAELVRIISSMPP